MIEMNFPKKEWICTLDKFQTEIKPYGQYEKMPYKEWCNIKPNKPYDRIKIEFTDKSIILHYYQVNLNTQKPIPGSWFHYCLSKSSSFGRYLIKEKDMELSVINGYDLSNCATTIDTAVGGNSDITAIRYDSINSNAAAMNTGWRNISDTWTNMSRLKQEIKTKIYLILALILAR